jgi:hypothetical protein
MITGQTGITSSCKPAHFCPAHRQCHTVKQTSFFVCRRRLPELISRAKTIEDRLHINSCHCPQYV